MALKKNRKKVRAILKALEPRILGKELPGMTCSCGAVHCGDAVAERIDPGGDSYPGQETQWALWSVRMKAHDGGSDWSCGLSFFVEADELRELFSRHFGNDKGENPYQLPISGADRVHKGLPAAVRIKENDHQIRFCVDWGREQEIARQLEELLQKNPRRIDRQSSAFMAIVTLLEQLNPEQYLGGPPPELPSESTWHLDFFGKLEEAAGSAREIFTQNSGRSISWRGSVYTNADVAFVK